MLTRSGFSQERTATQRRCDQCNGPFWPSRPMQRVCSPACAGRLVKAGKKQERAEVKRRKEAIKTIAQLIAAAQAAFNAWVRERDKDKGCFVCGRPFDQNIPGRALHAGHVRSRGAAGHLRYTEDNCLGECEGCNGPHGAKPHQIKAGAIARIGAERFAELENDNTQHKWQRDELIAIKNKYRAALRALKENQ